jgi:hypothetical protein
MRRPPDHRPPKGTPPELPAALVDYADRLLLGTGLQASEALLIASGELDAPAPLLARALRSGWELPEAAP